MAVPTLNSTSQAVWVTNSTVTWNHTIADGPNRLMRILVDAYQNTSFTVTSVKYNGVSAAFKNKSPSDAGAAFKIGVFEYELKGADLPSAGTYSCEIIVSATVSPLMGGADVWDNVDQTQGVHNTTGDYNVSNTGPAQVAVTAASDEVAICTFGGGGRTFTKLAANTLAWIRNDTNPTMGTSYQSGSGGTTTVGFTFSGGLSEWSVVGSALTYAASVTVAQYQNALDAQRNSPGIVGINHWWT